MKLSVGNRILMFVHWLLSLLICAALAVYVIAPDFILRYYNQFEASLGHTGMIIIGVAILAVFAVLAVIDVYLIFRRGKRADRGFITVDSSETGKTRIAIAAIEQMVRQSVHTIDGITEMKIGIENLDDAIAINVNASILNGSHVPTITMNMQRAIRQFVEMNCGVAVRAVYITINSVTHQQEAARKRLFGRQQGGRAEAAAADPTPAQPERESAWQAVPKNDTAGNGEVARADTVAETPGTYENEPEAAPSEKPAEGAPEEYDFNKPYESEFARDLAAMKAAEAQNAGADAGDEDALNG